MVDDYSMRDLTTPKPVALMSFSIKRSLTES